MDKYFIYWMKDDIAVEYFHKSGILYRFLKQYRDNKERLDLRLQYEFITNNFLKEQLIPHFKEFDCNEREITISENNILIEKNKQSITLQINDKHLQFRCSSLKDAEDLLFPILREYESSLFIVGDNIINYGWISPLENSKKDHMREVLYSSR